MGAIRPDLAQIWGQVGKVVRNGLHWGGEWGTVALHAEPGWRGSSHPATRVRNSGTGMRTLDLPRNLRTRARRETPTDGSLEVPCRARRRGGAGGLAGDDCAGAALNRDLDARGVRQVHELVAG